MKKLLLILLAFLPLLGSAKDDKRNSDPKYLAGAINLSDEGIVVFKQEVKAPTLSKSEIYRLMLDWAENRFQSAEPLKSSVPYKDEAKGEIAAVAEEYIVFSSSFISLDRTRINYQFRIYADDGICNMEMSRIRYWYDENRDGGDRFTAEEWITDDIALNRKKTKLAPRSGKFRRETIDLKDELFKSASAALGMKVLDVSNAAPSTIPATPLQPAVKTGELREITFAEIPANLNEIATSGRITLTANDETIDLKGENWGGFGKMFSKNVTYLLTDQSRIAVTAIMEHNETYTLSFYPGGTTEAAVIIECKKSMEQQMSAEDLKALGLSVDSSKNYKLYTGEITRIQAR